MKKNCFSILAILSLLLFSCENNDEDYPDPDEDLSDNITYLHLESDQVISPNTIPEILNPSIRYSYDGVGSRPPAGYYDMSLDKINWEEVGIENWSRSEYSRGYQPPALTQTTYYRVYCKGNVSNIVTITVK